MEKHEIDLEIRQVFLQYWHCCRTVKCWTHLLAAVVYDLNHKLASKKSQPNQHFDPFGRWKMATFCVCNPPSSFGQRLILEVVEMWLAGDLSFRRLGS